MDVLWLRTPRTRHRHPAQLIKGKTCQPCLYQRHITLIQSSKPSTPPNGEEVDIPKSLILQELKIDVLLRSAVVHKSISTDKPGKTILTRKKIVLIQTIQRTMT